MPKSTTYILLFRGVGGETQLPVDPLRKALTELGFTGVTTYINSGNALVRSTFTRDKTLAQVVELCKEQFGFDKPIFASTAAEWAEVIANNPFPNALATPKFLHAALLASAADAARIKAIQAIAVDGEQLKVVKCVAYIHTPNGFGTSKMAAKFAKGIGVVNTARNWNTVLKLHELALALEEM